MERARFITAEDFYPKKQGSVRNRTLRGGLRRGEELRNHKVLHHRYKRQRRATAAQLL